tara:strand:- start:1241 stop:1459 length:219 start_codon:yes stop_codon:yes gene_type:complete
MKKTDREIVSELFKKRTGKEYQNWIQAMAISHKKPDVKDVIFRTFVWLIFLPTGCVLSWYCVYKLIMWIFNV